MTSSHNGYRTWSAGAGGLGLTVAVAAGATIFMKYRNAEPRLSLLFRNVLVAFGVALSGVTFFGTYSEYANLRDALRQGRYRTVEGIVTDFQPGDYGGHRHETFKVGDARYSYLWPEITSAYNTPLPRGGFIREGLRVRIADVDGRIARLEVAHP